MTDEQIPPPPGGPLSDDEVRQMITLLARYAHHHLDQWEMWKIGTPYGPVFATLTNSLPQGALPEAFQPIWPLADRLRPPDHDQAD